MLYKLAKVQQYHDDTAAEKSITFSSFLFAIMRCLQYS